MRGIGLLGMVVFLGIAFALSSRRRAIRWRQVAWGIGLQAALAALVLKVEPVRHGFAAFAVGVEWVMSFTDRGAQWLFGSLARGEMPVASTQGEELGVARVGTIVILKILPTLIYVSALMSVLHHFGIVQRVVQGMAFIMERTMRVSGAEALSAAANVFMGMTEAPLLIRPYLPTMTLSELMAVMAGGFATISGSMMAVYSFQFGIPFESMLVASIISAPASLYLAKMALPETEVPATLGRVAPTLERETVNFIDAAALGATTGLKLALNVGAVLLAFAAGLALIDGCLAGLGRWWGMEGLSLGRILGWLFAPVAFLMGIPAAEAGKVGELLGIKVALNEFMAYESLSRSTTALSDRSRTMVIYALCGFANFGSIAIQLGGIGGLAPERRKDLARLGLRAMVLGALASITSATLAGLLLDL